MESFAAWYRKYLTHTDRMRRAWLLWQTQGDPDGEFLDGEGDLLDSHKALIRVFHFSILDFTNTKLPPSEQLPDGALVGVRYGSSDELFWLSEDTPPKYLGPLGRIGVKVVQRSLLLFESLTVSRYVLHVPYGPSQRLVIHTCSGLLVVHI